MFWLGSILDQVFQEVDMSIINYFAVSWAIMSLSVTIFVNFSSFSSTDNDSRTFAPNIRDATFLGVDTAWLSTSAGDLLLTNDGGSHWERISGATIGKFLSTSFINKTQGWAVNEYGKIWESFDGGRTWKEVGGLSKDKIDRVGLNQIVFVDDVHGWVIGIPWYIWRTDDGGRNWREYSTLQEKYRIDISRGFFLDAKNGWVTCSGGKLLKTRDGGQTWELLIVKLSTGLINDVSFVDKNVGLISGFPDFGLYKTVNGGQEWKLLIPFDQSFNSVAISSLSLVDKDEGWAAGQDKWSGGPNHRGALLHTMDGGKSWIPVKINGNDTIYSRVYFADKKHGWVIDRDNVYRTRNRGKSWQVILRFPPPKEE
jgi:photosystem II stability/assembly factor-like uncharacterized protein